MDPIRVAHLITSLDVGGAELTLLQLVTRSDPDRVRHEVIVLKPAGPVGAMLEERKIPVQSLAMTRNIADLTRLGRLVARLRDRRPAVLQTWLYHADLLGLLAGRRAGVPRVVWNLRASDLDLRARPITRLTRWACARASALVTDAVVNSTAGLRFHQSLGYRPRRWHLIPNGVDVERFRPDAESRLRLRRELGLDPDTTLVGLVARYDPVKDHATFLRAAARLSVTRPGVHFVLAGRGVEPGTAALTSLVGELGLGDRVRLLGERRDVASVTAALDLAALSSTSEGFPNTVLEAMACGVPCVATAAGDAAAIVGDAGEVVAPRDVPALAAALDRWLALDRGARERAGRRARERVACDFGLDAVVRRYDALYAGPAAGAAEPGLDVGRGQAARGSR
jgi:glycosyltransferase involved in cell wall biosynthesis